MLITVLLLPLRICAYYAAQPQSINPYPSDRQRGEKTLGVSRPDTKTTNPNPHARIPDPTRQTPDPPTGKGRVGSGNSLQKAVGFCIPEGVGFCMSEGVGCTAYTLQQAKRQNEDPGG